jgi:hypothetical protein
MAQNFSLWEISSDFFSDLKNSKKNQRNPEFFLKKGKKCKKFV